MVNPKLINFLHYLQIYMSNNIFFFIGAQYMLGKIFVVYLKILTELSKTAIWFNKLLCGFCKENE